MAATQFKTHTFKNGLLFLYRETKEDPITAAHLFFPRGTTLDPVGKEGLTTLYWGLLTKGTKTKSAKLTAEILEGFGAQASAGAATDYSEVSCHTISENIVPVLELFFEMILEPAFKESEFTKEQTALMAAIESKKDSLFTITQEKLQEALYRGHPYGRAASGRVETVQSLRLEDLPTHHAKLVQPAGAVLSMAGDLPFETVVKNVEKLVEGTRWPKPETPLLDLTPMTSAPKMALLEQTATFEQAYVMIAYPAPALSAPSYAVVKILNGLLGGGMSSRLFQELREKEALAYELGSYFPSRKKGSELVIYIGTRANDTKKTVTRIHEELEKLKTTPVLEDERAFITRHMKGSYVLDHQTNGQRAHYLGWWHILGQSYEYDDVYPEALMAVTAAQLKEAANEIFSKPSVTVITKPKK